MSLAHPHSVGCSVLGTQRQPLHRFVSRKHAARPVKCSCSAQQKARWPALPAQLSLYLAAPAAFAEEVQQQAQQAVEQGQQVVGQAQEAVEQAQQQFKLPADLQYPSGSGIKLPREFDPVTGFAGQYPAIIAAGVAVVAIGFVIAQLVGQGVKVKPLSAAKAFDFLSEEPNAVFIDLRSKEEIKEAGSPDLRSIKQKIINLPYTVGKNLDIVEGFSDKLLSLSAVSENTDVILFDSYGKDAKNIAKAVQGGVKHVYWVSDGADGVKGWKASQLPWKEPSRGFNFSFPNFSGVNIDKLADDFKSKPTLTKAGLAVGAVGAAAVVLFNEVEIVLEVLGVAAAGNFLAKKLLFAKDREQTVDQIRDIVDNKIAAGSVGKDLRRVTDTLVETATTTERTVEKKVSPQIKDAAKSAKDTAKDVQSKAKSAGKDLEKTADKAADKAQSQAKQVQSKGKDAVKDAEKTADRTADKAQSQTSSLQSKGKDAAKDIKSEAKSAGKDVAKTADKAADKAQSQTKDLQSKGKDVTKDIKSEAKSAGKDAAKTADKAGSQVQQGAQKAQSGASGTKDDAQRKFEKQKAEVVGESKENIKEAESTLQAKGKSKSSNGAGEPGVPSQQDVKQQAKEARNWIKDWIKDWRKKQPSKADA